MECKPKKLETHTRFMLQGFRIILTKIYKIQPPVLLLLFYCSLPFTLVDAFFQNLLELHSALSEKRFWGIPWKSRHDCLKKSL